MSLKYLVAGLLSCSLIQPSLSQIQTTIQEVQMVDTGGSTDDSAFLGQTVQITGVVTASAQSNNLDAVYIQQEGATEWAGIQLFSGVGLGSVEVGDLITVTGDVSENGGMTVINFVTDFEVVGTGQISPLMLDPSIFTSYSLASNEQYEGMLIEFPDAGDLVSVVSANADGPNNNFGEWRVGTDPENGDSGCRVLTGRQTSSVTSSLNVSWVNDEAWATNSGTMNVAPIVVEDGDAFESIRGIMYYGQGDFKLLPRNNDDITLKTSATRGIHSPVLNASLSPNPTSGPITLQFELDRPTSLTAYITDSAGDIVHHMFERDIIERGRHAIRTDVTLPQGVYFCTILSPAGRSTLKFVQVD